MPTEDERRATFLTNNRFVVDNFDVYEVAEQMDDVKEDNKQQTQKAQNKC